MLGRIRARLERTLREERGCPVRVEYGTVTPARVNDLRDLVVIRRAPTDKLGPPKARGGNPPRRFNRSIGCIVEVHARFPGDGGRQQDHEDRCDALVDQVLVALDDVLRGGELDENGVQVPNTQHAWAPGVGGFEEPVGGVSIGALYKLELSIDRGVHDAPFDNSPAPEFTFGADSIASRTDVFGSTGEGAGETSCGGN